MERGAYARQHRKWGGEPTYVERRQKEGKNESLKIECLVSPD